MSVRMRITHGQTGSRRSHHHVEAPRLTKTQNGNTSRRHFVDPQTGEYRGKRVKDLAAQHQKRAQRRAQRMRAFREEQEQQTSGQAQSEEGQR